MAPEFSDGTGEGRGNGAAAATDIWEPAEDGDGEGGEGDGDGVADDDGLHHVVVVEGSEEVGHGRRPPEMTKPK